MSERKMQLALHTARPQRRPQDPLSADAEDVQRVCPICGAMVEGKQVGKNTGWVCIAGGYAHYYQAKYAHLEQWFTSGEGNLREPLIGAMNCAA